MCKKVDNFCELVNLKQLKERIDYERMFNCHSCGAHWTLCHLKQTTIDAMQYVVRRQITKIKERSNKFGRTSMWVNHYKCLFMDDWI